MVKSSKARKAKETAVAYAFMAPALIIILLFTVIPIFASLGLMFFDYSVLGKTKFVGLGNFIKAFNDREFIIAIKNLSLLVNRKLRGIGIFRTLFYIPVITSMVAVSIIWGFIFNSSGVINTLLSDLGLITQPLGFISDKKTAMLCLMFITLWQGLGYYMMMYLAGLQGIPSELGEAARIDGAGTLRVITSVIIPQLKPFIWLCTLNSIISAIGVFDVVFVLSKGGPDNATMVINYYSYTKAFGEFRFGYAAAVGAVQAIITSIVSIAVFIYGKRGGMTNNE